MMRFILLLAVILAAHRSGALFNLPKRTNPPKMPSSVKSQVVKTAVPAKKVAASVSAKAAPVPTKKVASFSSTFMVANSFYPKKVAAPAPAKKVAAVKATTSSKVAGVVGDCIALYRKEQKNSAKSDAELVAVFKALAKALGSEASAATCVKNVPTVLNAKEDRITGNFKVYSDKFGADKARGMVERNPGKLKEIALISPPGAN